MSVSIRPEALADISEAYLWYEGQRAGLGEEFLQAIDERLAELSESPNRYRLVLRDARLAPLRRFP